MEVLYKKWNYKFDFRFLFYFPEILTLRNVELLHRRSGIKTCNSRKIIKGIDLRPIFLGEKKEKEKNRRFLFRSMI